MSKKKKRREKKEDVFSNVKQLFTKRSKISQLNARTRFLIREQVVVRTSYSIYMCLHPSDTVHENL